MISETKMKLNISQVKNFIKEHTKQDVTEVGPLRGGNWSQAFSYRLGHRDYVARFGNHVNDYEKDKIATSFGNEKLPIARVLEVGEAFNGYFAISERAYGSMLDKLNTDSMQKIVPAVLNMLDCMRQINIEGTTGYGAWDKSCNADFDSWSDYLLQVAQDNTDSRTHGWRKNLEQSPFGDDSFNKAYNKLQKLVKYCPSDRHIIHTDLLNDNVLVKDDKISSIIDWGNSIYGDFLYELAEFSYWASWFPSMKDIDWEDEAKRYYLSRNIDLPNFEKRMLCYKIHIGLDAQAYNAFTKKWDELAINTHNTLKLL